MKHIVTLFSLLLTTILIGCSPAAPPSMETVQLTLNGELAEVKLPDTFASQSVGIENSVSFTDKSTGSIFAAMRNDGILTEDDLSDPNTLELLGATEEIETLVSHKIITLDSGKKALDIFLQINQPTATVLQKRVVVESEAGWILLITGKSMTQPDFDKFSQDIAKTFVVK